MAKVKVAVDVDLGALSTQTLLEETRKRGWSVSLPEQEGVLPIEGVGTKALADELEQRGYLVWKREEQIAHLDSLLKGMVREGFIGSSLVERAQAWDMLLTFGTPPGDQWAKR
jgi:hypothetical protein